ncbi:MAG: hypothetical protein RIG61_09940 [Deltaproteobacteria bacterium]
MRDSLSSVFSYLFMTAVFISVISAFGIILILIRSFIVEISEIEKQTGFIFLYIFLACIILAPIFLFISNKLEKYGKRVDEV